MSKTGGGRGSNQYGPKGRSRARRPEPGIAGDRTGARASLRRQAEAHAEGDHTIADGEIHVCGGARVTGTGRASVMGWGESRVIVTDQASAAVCEQAHATGTGRSTLHVGGKAHGVATDDVTMTVAGDGTGEGAGRAQVTGTGRARVVLRDNATGVISDRAEADIADDVELVALGRSRVRAGGRSVVWAEPGVEVELTGGARREPLPVVA